MVFMVYFLIPMVCTRRRHFHLLAEFFGHIESLRAIAFIDFSIEMSYVFDIFSLYCRSIDHQIVWPCTCV